MWGNVGNRRNMRQPLQGSPECQKVEVQEALPPAGVIGAESLTLVPQHFPRKPAQRCLRARAANMVFQSFLFFEQNSV